MIALKLFSAGSKKKKNKLAVKNSADEQTDGTGAKDEEVGLRPARPPAVDSDEEAGQTVELKMSPRENLPFEILEEIMILHSDAHI